MRAAATARNSECNQNNFLSLLLEPRRPRGSICAIAATWPRHRRAIGRHLAANEDMLS